jgi:ferredoxin-NADP reductase
VPAKARDCRARVVRLTPLAPAVLEAELSMDDPPRLDFDAGQWVSVPFGPKIVRAYTIASTPREGTSIALCADVTPDGLGSKWFRALAPDQVVEFKGPLGGFVFDPADARRPIFVAEEIGIVPIRSIIAWLDETGALPPSMLIYEARDRASLVYDAEFAALAQRDARFVYHPIVDGGSETLVDAVARLVTETTDTVGYVAGGEQTIKRVREVLTSRGMERKAVKWERFW